MKEKETKENQGIRDAGQVSRVLQTRQRGSRQVAGDNNASEKSTRKTSLPSAEGLSLMKEKEVKENQGIRDACQVSRVLQTRQRGSRQVAGDNNASEKSTRKTSLPSAEGLSLMKEKEAKENQGIRDACQVGRVLQTRQIDLCQVACIRPNFVGGRSRLDLLLPSFLLSREEKKGRFL